jgi:hypothetical protein
VAFALTLYHFAFSLGAWLGEFGVNFLGREET